MKSSLPPPDVSFKALLRLAGPIYVANLAIIGSGTIDTIMAGQLGKDHLAAIALGIASTISVLMGLVGILQGLSPIAGHHFGAQRYGRIGEELEQNFWLAGLLSLIGVPILLCTDFWISLGQVKGEVARMTAQYMFWTAMALPFSMGARSFISLNAAVSRPRVTMWVSLGMLALKAPLNAIFMYGWFGFPALGGGGAGISFFTLSVLAFFTYLIIWKRDPFYKRMHVDRITPPIWSFLKEQLRVGVPIGLCTFFEVSSFTLMAIFVSRFGSEIISAHQIVANLTSMCYMIPLSIGIATSVLISQCLGARWPGIAFLVLKRSLLTTVVIAAVMSALLFILREPIIWLYTREAGVHALACALVVFGCGYHVFDAMQTVSSFSLRGYRVTTLPMIVYGVMLWGVGLGCGYFLAFEGDWVGGPYGVYGFWGATAFGLLLTGVSLAAMSLWVGRHFSLDEEHSAEEIARVLAKK